MAKAATIAIKMLSTADTGFFYVAKKNPRKKPEKFEFRKYDPVVRKHVLFKETKIKYRLSDKIRYPPFFVKDGGFCYIWPTY